MIIDLPHPLHAAFHTDPECPDWTSFLKFQSTLNPHSFWEDVLTDAPFRARFFAFMDAFRNYEKNLQVSLESLVLSEAFTPPLQVAIQPQECPTFNPMFGHWEGFLECMLKECASLPIFIERLRSSRPFREEVLSFLQDATAFEGRIA